METSVSVWVHESTEGRITVTHDAIIAMSDPMCFFITYTPPQGALYPEPTAHIQSLTRQDIDALSIALDRLLSATE